MRFWEEAELLWWQAADVLAAAPWDGKRRIDPERLNRLEKALAKFEFREIQGNIPREFRFRGIRFSLAAMKRKREENVEFIYHGFSGDIRRGKVAFHLKKTGPVHRQVRLEAEQDRMDHFMRERDASVFKELVDSFSEHVRVNF